MFSQQRAYPLILISLALALGTRSSVFIWAAMLIVAVLIVRPGALEPVVGVFELITKFLGTWVSNIVLGLIFFLLVTPYSFLYRFLQKKITKHFFDARGVDSYFSVEKREYLPESFEKTW